MADARPSSDRIIIDHDGTRYRFARSRTSPLVICRLVPFHNGRSYWRDMSASDWTALPAEVRTQVIAKLRIPMRERGAA